MKSLFRKVGSALVVFGGVVAAGAANAAAVAAVDVTDVTTGLSNQSTPITSIATALMGLAVIMTAFHWIRKALGK